MKILSLFMLALFAVFSASAGVLPEFRFDRLPTHYTGKILPAPKKVSYTGTFLPAKEVAIVPAKGIAAEDIRVRFLRDRLELAGAKVTIGAETAAQAGAVVSLSLDETIGRSEGYTIRFDGKKTLAIAGNDPLGMLWGATTLAQMIRATDGKPELQAVEVSDWPDVAKRGFLAQYWPGVALEYILFCKANTVVFQYGMDSAGFREFPNGPRDQELLASLREYGTVAAALGLDLRYMFSPVRGENGRHFSASDESDFQKSLEHALVCAENGLGVYLAFDDFRFPPTPEDQARFGNAREADIYFVNRLFRETRAKFPGFRMVFCPPFYWGPDAPATYSEDREEYLSACGERLDPAIDFFWTGPRVKFVPPTPEKVAWVRRLYHRKPWTFINGKQLSHSYFYNYVTDTVKWWKEQLYPGFWDEMGAALINAHGRYDASSTATFCDSVWNVPGYDAAASNRQVVGLFFGSENYELFDRVNRAQSFFDQYENWEVTPGAAKNLPAVEKALAELEASCAAAKEANGFAFEGLTIFPRTLGLSRRFVEKLRKNPGLNKYAAMEQKVREDATAECSPGPKDILLGPTAFHGGATPALYGIRGCPKRLATWIYGKQTKKPAMAADFICEPFPVERDYTLVLSGQDHDGDMPPCRIAIKVNGKVIFSGDPGMPKLAWATKSFPIPAECLQRNNKLEIENLEDSDNSAGPPFFMLNYALLKK